MNVKVMTIVLTGVSLIITGCVQENLTKTSTDAPKKEIVHEFKKSPPKVQVVSGSQAPSTVKESPPQKPKPKESISKGARILLNPSYLLAVVNKQQMLPSDYKPNQLVAPQIPFYFSEDLPKRYMRAEAAKAIEQLFQKAKTDGIDLVAASGYRSYQRQKDIFTAEVNKVGEQKANQVVAFPGQSEHQTGLAMDVTSKAMKFQLEEKFAETKEGRWLKENAHLYGFIIRYPKGKEKITGYQFEPWHIRYIGKEAATDMYANQIATLEQYVEGKQQANK